MTDEPSTSELAALHWLLRDELDWLDHVSLTPYPERRDAVVAQLTQVTEQLRGRDLSGVPRALRDKLTIFDVRA